MATAERPRSTLSERLGRAWFRHPVIAFVRHRKLITFYQQLTSLIRAGVALPTAFNQLQQFAPDAAMERGLAAVARDVRGGRTLGDAMRTHSALFDDAYVELIAFAEEAGRLQPVAEAIVAHLERVQKQRWRTVMGALWPLYLAGAAVFAGPLLEVAQNVNSTSSIGSLYASALASSVLTAGLTFTAVLGFPFFIAALDAGVGWDRVVRKLPLISSPMRQLAASRLVLGLGLASASGMEVVRSLRLAARATSRPSVLADLPLAEARLRNGSTLVDAVSALGVLDRSSLGTLAVAETTGTLDSSLEKLSTELEAASLRAMRFLALAITALITVMLLIKIVMGLLGTLFGPVKKLYDAAGSGSLERD
ncbi:MAG: type II secretion system F family protein [Archangium sp.]